MEYRLFTKIFIFLGICSFFILILQPYSQLLLRTKQNINCSKSLRESNNFICESDELWNERKVLYRIQDNENMRERKSKYFFLSNWEPNFHCSHARRIGKMGDGGKWVCDVFRLKTRSDCLIYSVGSRNDFSFETGIKNTLPKCEIHTFDSNLYKCPNDVCEFHKITFGNGTYPRGSKSWQRILEELNHTDRSIDVLKIDIEGGEYGFLPTIFESLTDSVPRQILIELHRNKDQTIHAFFKLLRDNGYVIFNKEANLLAGQNFFEYGFLRLNYRFFQ